MRNKEKEKARQIFLYQTKWLPAYLAFIALYPFGLEDLFCEIWRWIKGYEGLYQISNYGRVKSFPRNGTINKIKILKPSLAKGGYLRISLNKKDKGEYFQIHRLVAQAFISNPQNKPHVNHRFGVKFDCYFENLEWSTIAENNKHAYDTGLKKSGERHVNSKLTNEDVKFIREHYIPRSKEYGEKALAEKFNVTILTIGRVIHRKTYKNVE